MPFGMPMPPMLPPGFGNPPYGGARTPPPRGRERNVRPRMERSVYQPDPGAERPEDSKPCRVLFVRNIAYEVDVAEFKATFESFGPVKSFFDLIHRRGLMFVTYYDTRAAEQAKLHMHGRMIVGRQIDVHYSLPRDEDQQQHCDRDKNQGTLFVLLRGGTEPLTEEVLRATFSPFGEIRNIRKYKDQAHTRFLEFWDSRACVAAHDQLHETPFLGGRLTLRFAWDLATVSLVTDARNRSEAKAAVEARAREQGERPAGAHPWGEPKHGASPVPDDRLEQAQKVQRLLASLQDAGQRTPGSQSAGTPPSTAAATDAAQPATTPPAATVSVAPAPSAVAAPGAASQTPPVLPANLADLLRQAGAARGAGAASGAGPSPGEGAANNGEPNGAAGGEATNATPTSSAVAAAPTAEATAEAPIPEAATAQAPPSTAAPPASPTPEAQTPPAPPIEAPPSETSQQAVGQTHEPRQDAEGERAHEATAHEAAPSAPPAPSASAEEPAVGGADRSAKAAERAAEAQ